MYEKIALLLLCYYYRDEERRGMGRREGVKKWGG